jgi:hypothetical protein
MHFPPFPCVILSDTKFWDPNNIRWCVVQITKLLIMPFLQPRTTFSFLGPNTYPDDGDSKHLWNVGKLLPDYTALRPRRQQSILPALRTCNLT